MRFSGPRLGGPAGREAGRGKNPRAAPFALALVASGNAHLECWSFALVGVRHPVFLRGAHPLCFDGDLIISLPRVTTATEALQELGYFTVSRCGLIAQRSRTNLNSGRTAAVHLPPVRQHRGQELATI